MLCYLYVLVLFLDVLVHFSEDKFYVNEADPLAYVTVNVEYTDPLQRPISIK